MYVSIIVRISFATVSTDFRTHAMVKVDVCSLLVVTLIWGHTVGSSPPSLLRVLALASYREKDSVLSSLVN